MDRQRRTQLRATGYVRTLIVACATLAILLVCFAIYDYSQADPDDHAGSPNAQTLSTDIPADGDNGGVTAADAPAVAIGESIVGPGHKSRITIYPRKGKRAKLEIAVDSWAPVAGSANEFVLDHPEVRMHTKDGHAVRVLAVRGILQGKRESGGGLDPRRGRLIGDVVIEYDRLSQDERALLATGQDGALDPDQIVRIELDEIEFDLEYSKVIAPGRLRLTAREVELDADNLEIRFNELENRVEYMRLGQFGRLLLREESEQPKLGLPGSGSPTTQLTVAQWLWATIQARLDARQTDQDEQPVAAQPSPTSVSTVADSGLPVFQLGADENDAPKPSIRYHARFEGAVLARQFAEGELRAQLDADVLEILRDLADKAQVGDPGRLESAALESGRQPSTAADHMILEWSERLVLETCAPDDERCLDETRSKLVATGSPARISVPQGEATCVRLSYEPDTSGVWLYGTDAEPVMVRFAGQGTVTGLAVYSRRQDDEMYIRVEGPGTLIHEPDESSLKEATDVLPGGRSVIEFSDELEIHGRFVESTTFDFTDGLATRERRVLDRASFLGQVRLRQEDLALSADAAVFTFSDQGASSGRGQSIERVTANGQVVLAQGADQLSSRELVILFAKSSDGTTGPRTLIATGNVKAAQGERYIEAGEKLIVDFDFVTRPGPSNDPVLAYAEAIRSGANLASVDWQAKRQAQESATRTRSVVTRLRASGGVTVSDPTQMLELASVELDCHVAADQNIESALVTGAQGQPATVRLDAFTVTGLEITVDLPAQRANVPGAGRLTFRSLKDLDGRKLTKPIPIAITWNDWMTYDGQENRSVFSGNVHATSETTTTFDCDHLTIEFDDVAADSTAVAAVDRWGFFQDMIDKVAGRSKRSSPATNLGFAKEPAKIIATGHAVAMTSELDPITQEVQRRARIAGPELWVNLRPDVSKMVIEGAGTLLLEDYRSPRPQTKDASPNQGGLFGFRQDGGPSNTLIEWNELMQYDFSVNQIRFEGDVDLKHFSGNELARLRGTVPAGSAETIVGRATFLSCDVLTVDFLDRNSLDRSKRSGRSPSRRMGRLGADRLRQFLAEGDVQLEDRNQGLSLRAGRVTYERQRRILVIDGSAHRKARIITQRPGQLPSQVTVDRLVYNLDTGQIELSKSTLSSR